MPVGLWLPADMSKGPGGHSLDRQDGRACKQLCGWELDVPLGPQVLKYAPQGPRTCSVCALGEPSEIQFVFPPPFRSLFLLRHTEPMQGSAPASLHPYIPWGLMGSPPLQGTVSGNCFHLLCSRLLSAWSAPAANVDRLTCTSEP